MGNNGLPHHIGFIPDGNRRWAQQKGLPKHEGYAAGIEPGFILYNECREAGIREVSIYGFTKDNTKRPVIQKNAFRRACVDFARELFERGAALLVLGDDESDQFPQELKFFRIRRGEGMKVNFLVNYDWEWDLLGFKNGRLHSHEVSRVDLIVRWGGGSRLSGFLPVQSVYADIYVLDKHWPDFNPSHFKSALDWFKKQDRTLGG